MSIKIPGEQRSSKPAVHKWILFAGLLFLSLLGTTNLCTYLVLSTISSFICCSGVVLLLIAIFLWPTKNRSSRTVADLKTRKLRQETHWFKVWCVPALTIATLVGSGYIALFTNVLENKREKFEADKAKNDRSMVEASIKSSKEDISLLLKSIQLIRGNFGLEIEQQSLNSRKARLTKKNDSLFFSNERLSTANSLVSQQYSTTKKELETANSDLYNLNKQNRVLGQNAETYKVMIDFGELNYHLALIKRLPANNSLSRNALVKGLKDRKFRIRITDSLETFSKSHRPYLFGISNAILYFGTGEKKYKDSLFEEIEHRYNFTDNGKILYPEIVTGDWTDEEDKELIKIFMRILNRNLKRDDAVCVIRYVSQILDENAEMDLHKMGFAMFDNYIAFCRKYLDDEMDDRNNIDIMKALAIVCPQIYVAQHLLILETLPEDLTRLFKKNIKESDTALLNKYRYVNDRTNIHQTLSQKRYEQVEFFFGSIAAVDKKGKKVKSFKELNMANRVKVNFWNDYFNGSSRALMTEVKKRIMVDDF